MSTYRQRVQAMCTLQGIPNPIQEADLIVKTLSFRVDKKWVKIVGTDMNRAGRLFFQHCYLCSLKPIASQPRKKMSGVTADGLHLIGKKHFGELWDDAEEQGRSLLTAFKAADYVEVHFK